MSGIYGSINIKAWIEKSVTAMLQRLGVAGGAALVGYKGGTVEAALDAASARNVAGIDLSALIQLDERTVVMTGDSLLANAYQFAPGLEPGNYAYKNPYGLQAWGHMLRDSIYASTLPFTFATEAEIEFTKGVSRYPNVNPAYVAPFNGNLETFLVQSAVDEIRIRTNFIAPNSAVRVMFFTGNQTQFPNIAKFDLYADDEFIRTVDLAGNPDFYRGAYQLNIDAKTGSNSITLKNIRCSNGQAGAAAVQIIGYTAARVNVHMTGHGGWSSGQILDDYQNMVGQYAPDDLFYIVGANDLGLGIPVATTKENIEALIVAVRTAKPAANIVLISTTPMTEFPISGVAGDQLQMMRELAEKYGGYFVNLYDVLGKMSPAHWRADNVHTTIAGGNYIYQAVRNMVYPSMKTNPSYLARAEYQFLPIVPMPVRAPLRRKQNIVVEIDGDGTPVVSADDAFYVTATTTPEGLFIVTPGDGVRIRSVSVAVNVPGRYYVGNVKELSPGGAYQVLVMNLLADPKPALLTTRAQLAQSYFIVMID